MADITMCAQTLCPNAGVCYRVQATPSDWQIMAAFDYTVSARGVECGNYLPMYRATASDKTVPNVKVSGPEGGLPPKVALDRRVGRNCLKTLAIKSLEMTNANE